MGGAGELVMKTDDEMVKAVPDRGTLTWSQPESGVNAQEQTSTRAEGSVRPGLTQTCQDAQSFFIYAIASAKQHT